MKPLISIAIVTYNQVNFISECINSCLSQTYNNIEIVISDDGSTDGTMDVILDYERKYPKIIKVVTSNVNSGVSINFNRAWKLCAGEWIKSIAGDDRLKLECLDLFLQKIIADDYLFDLYFSDMDKFDQRGVFGVLKIDNFFKSLSDEERLTYLLCKNPLLAPTSFVRKKALESVGYACERYRMIEDYPLWLSFVLSGYKIGFVDKSTVDYRITESLSNNVEKICNIDFVNSLHYFRRDRVWPLLTGFLVFKKIDDLMWFYQNKIGYKYFSNKKSFIFSFLGIFFAPLRIFSLIVKYNLFIRVLFGLRR